MCYYYLVKQMKIFRRYINDKIEKSSNCNINLYCYNTIWNLNVKAVDLNLTENTSDSNTTINTTDEEDYPTSIMQDLHQY